MTLGQGHVHPFSSNAGRRDGYACCKGREEAARFKICNELPLWSQEKAHVVGRAATQTLHLLMQSPPRTASPHSDCSSTDTGMAELPFLTFVNKQFVSTQILLRNRVSEEKGEGRIKGSESVSGPVNDRKHHRCVLQPTC